MSATIISIEEQSLMASIREKYSPSILPACQATPFPASLLAGLTANETGISPEKKRFESSVFVDLGNVLAGKVGAFGSIGAQDLEKFILWPDDSLVRPSTVLQCLIALATSWGPTQIMGYQVLGFRGSVVAPPYREQISSLNVPESHFAICVSLLGQFKNEFHLPDPAVDASGYFHCWNSGSPGGRTFDPNYAANGIRRMKIYESLPAAPAQEESAT